MKTFEFDHGVHAGMAEMTKDPLLDVEPDTEIHFWLDDESPRCVLTLRHVGSSTSRPLSFKVCSLQPCLSIGDSSLELLHLTLCSRPPFFYRLSQIEEEDT